MALADTALRNAKLLTTQYKLYYDDGLLIVTPSGGKLWRFKYRVSGVEKQLYFGGLLTESLKVAQQQRDEA